MQLVCAFDLTPEKYVTDEFQRKVESPTKCPNCNQRKSLLALGYYGRNLSRSGLGALLILIRRFRCRFCRRTTSILPSFAQPYRFVQNTTIDRYFKGDFLSSEILRHWDLLSQYQRRFERFVPELIRLTARTSERAPPYQLSAVWRSLVSIHGDLSFATEFLVSAHQITPFGRYRCHRPNGKKN